MPMPLRFFMEAVAISLVSTYKIFQDPQYMNNQRDKRWLSGLLRYRQWQVFQETLNDYFCHKVARLIRIY